MTRDEAIRLIQSLALTGGVSTVGLNEKNLGGLALPGYEVYFEYTLPFTQEEPSLTCRALIYRFRKPPAPGLVEAFRAEAAAGTPAGGGELEYVEESQGLFLSRTYRKSPGDAAFVADMKALGEASRHWGGEVLERVTAKVFHPAG